MQCRQGCLSHIERFEAEHRARDPLWSSVIFLHQIMQIFGRADVHRGSMLGVVGDDGGGVCTALVDDDLLGRAAITTASTSGC